MTTDNRLRPLSEALEDHSAEGIAILTSEPWRFTQAAVYTMVALVLVALMWSFFGRADVIVSAQGTLQPESEVRRLYAPIDGELANLYMDEGQPVSKGDTLARLNARGAIEAAKNALEAQLKLEDAEREWREFPQKKALLERKVAALKQAMEVEEYQNTKRMSEGTGRRTPSPDAPAKKKKAAAKKKAGAKKKSPARKKAKAKKTARRAVPKRKSARRKPAARKK